MKKALYLFLFLCTTTVAESQLYVQKGAMFHVGSTLTLQNEDFIMGPGGSAVITFVPGSNVLFTGNADNIISGYIGFLNLEISKSGGHQVSLQNDDIEVSGQMVFTSGFFNLNSNTLLLGSTGTLINENENSRVIGPSGGTVNVSMPLNQPNNVNPGNIGAEITSARDLGTVTIDRGYVYSLGLPSKSVQRYYSFNFADPSKDADLDATLRLHYFDAESFNADESKLVPWKFDNVGQVWTEQGPSSSITRNTTDNWLQLTGIPELSTWTLAETAGAVPVTFSSFRIDCEDNISVIRWQTVSESNTHLFAVQRSINGRDWVTIATQNAAGQSNSVQNYSFADQTNNTWGRILYRIKSIDKDGSECFTVVNTTSCGIYNDWHIWPNPVRQHIWVSLSLEKPYKTSVRLLDSKGTLVRHWQKNLLGGYNKFVLDVQDIPKGGYHLLVTWDNGNGQRSDWILKQ